MLHRVPDPDKRASGEQHRIVVRFFPSSTPTWPARCADHGAGPPTSLRQSCRPVRKEPLVAQNGRKQYNAKNVQPNPLMSEVPR